MRFSRRVVRVLGIFGCVVWCGAPVVRAADSRQPPQQQLSAHQVCPICGRTDDDTMAYPTKAGHALLRGASNVLFGWTELIRQPAEEAQDGGNLFTGFVHGIGSGVSRTVAGAGDILTFWTPKTSQGYMRFTHDCPVCGKGKP